MTEHGIQVRAFRTIEPAAQLSGEIDALNLASRRPSPFSTFAFLRTSLGLGEEGRGELLLLVAFERERVIGYLPLRKLQRRMLGTTFGRIQALTQGYGDRPQVVARSDDEARCAAAFYRFLIEQERGWSELEFTSQDDASALNAVPPLRLKPYYVRKFGNAPNTTIDLTQPSLRDYYASLDGDFRRRVRKRARQLLAAGHAEVIASSGSAAARFLFEMYLDVERRSWKAPARTGLFGHPHQRELVKTLCEDGQPTTPIFDFVLLDGVPIAGFLSVEFNGNAYGLETAYDAAYADLSPGYLLHVMCMRHVMARGLRSLNLLHEFTYYKTYWKGVVTPTSAVQIFRLPGLPYFKARLGELKRALASRKQSVLYNPARRVIEEGAKGAAVRPSRAPEAERAAASLAQLTGDAQTERLSGDALLAVLPFDPQAKKGTPRPGNARTVP